MGVTNFEIELLKKVIKDYNPKNVCELGSQNLYLNGEEKPPFASDWYLSNGFDTYVCIDLAGDNSAIQKDLSHRINLGIEFDLVTDFGSSEHCVQVAEYVYVPFHEGYINSVYPKEFVDTIQIKVGYYECWLNKHNLLKEDGIMINVNPMVGNWIGHGYSYLSSSFYTELSKLTDYKIIETGIHAAMGNDIDGWNVYSVLQKKSDIFPDFKTFQSLPIYKK